MFYLPSHEEIEKKQCTHYLASRRGMHSALRSYVAAQRERKSGGPDSRGVVMVGLAYWRDYRRRVREVAGF